MSFDQKKIQLLYKKLLAFYPPEFRSQFGESMAQTFNDLCNEQKKTSHKISFGIVIWMFFETSSAIFKEHYSQIKKGKFMENIIPNQKTSAIFGLILALPLALILLISMWNIEPLNGYLQAMTTMGEGYQLSAFGKIFLITVILLLPTGFIMSLVPIVKNVRNGNGIMASPFNLVVTALLFIFVAGFITAFVIDQYPCWMGVPNCD